MIDYKGLYEKDKHKEDSPGVVMTSTEIGETSILEGVPKGRKKDTTKVVLEKTRPEMEEYPFRKEIEDLLKSPVLEGETTSQITEEGKIGTPKIGRAHV